MPPRRGASKRQSHERKRAPQRDLDADEMPLGPRVFDASDDEPEGIVGEDEEIDSDEAFGESDDDFITGRHGKGDEQEDFGNEGVDLSTMLDEAPDDGEDEEEEGDEEEDDQEDDGTLDQDLAALLSKRSADGDQDAPSKRARTIERTEAMPEGTDAAGTGGKLRLEDLLQPLAGDSALSNVPSNVRALGEGRREADPVASRRGGGVLRAPLPGVVQDRMDRQAAYALFKEDAQGWQPTIKRLREAEHLSFPLQRRAEPPKPSTAGLTASFVPSTGMERSVASLLEDSGLTERQISQQEDLALRQVDPQEAARRRAELRRMRELMFRAEQKARRANKIKSRSYRRVHRRERERQAEQNEPDEDALEKAERERARERATLRHKNTGKWAKSILGRHGEEEARMAVEDQLLRGDQLRQKVHVEDSDSDVGDYDDDGDVDLDEFEERENQIDADLEDEIQRNDKKGKSVFNMKFMKDARERQRKETEETIRALREDGEEPEDRPVGRAKFGEGAIAAPEASANPWMTDESSGARSRKRNSVLVGKDSGSATRAAHRTERHAARGAEAQAAAADDATLAIDPSAQIAPAESSDDEQPTEVVPGTARPRTKRGSRGKKSTLMPLQRELVAEAFAGDDVALDFAREKRAAMDADAPKEEDTTMPGWGAWGGKGARPTKKQPKQRTAGLDPSKRKDYAMDNVIINERRDKKADKYKAKDLPYPYTSAAQYEAAMRLPIGSEWNTRTQHQRLTLPRVATKMGQRIDPIHRGRQQVRSAPARELKDVTGDEYEEAEGSDALEQDEEDDEDEDDEDDVEGDHEEYDDEDSDEQNDDEEGDEGDEDEDEGSGYAQFIDESDDDGEDDDEEPESESETDDESRLQKRACVLTEIQAIPYSHLLKASKKLRNQRQSDEPDDVESRRAAARSQLRDLGFGKEKSKPKEAPSAPAKREQKNAPMVMGIHKPVSRKRTVVEPEHRAKQRDPRFDSLSAGPANLDLARKSYGFLPELYENELKELRDKFAATKRMEKHHAGPRAKSQQAATIREERANTELALRRAESQQNERMRRENERLVNQRIKKENQRRVDSGLRPYFPKKAERKEAVLRNKFEQLGDSSAIRKTMERRMRKDTQKERKGLDAALGGGARTDAGRGTPARLSGQPPRKRGKRG